MKKYRVTLYDMETRKFLYGYKEFVGKHKLRQGLSNICNDEDVMIRIKVIK